MAVPVAAAGLHHVRVQRALDEKLHAALRLGDLARRPLEGADELAADDLALGLRVGDPGQRVEELLRGVDE